ncbi:MAG: hypothetical protein JST36_07870 [Bacteroidetes bacterium]|nr:hypothetical protein [Bacteroidota bacterium]
MLLLIILGWLIYYNIRLAKKKGKNPISWGIFTFLGFFLSYAILGSIYVAIIYKGPITREGLEAYLMKEPLVATMLLAIGIGGALLVRFILEKSKGTQNKQQDQNLF